MKRFRSYLSRLLLGLAQRVRPFERPTPEPVVQALLFSHRDDLTRSGRDANGFAVRVRLRGGWPERSMLVPIHDAQEKLEYRLGRVMLSQADGSVTRADYFATRPWPKFDAAKEKARA